uniref:Protein kinase domain-containing protein n=1 Tax=Timema monikensis TaxID=170555 RepID=A0A7R9E695_9NEOP|nr:unnamed protein product [Timema monikensis]
MPSLKLTVENQVSYTLQRKGYRLGRNMAEGSYCKVKMFDNGLNSGHRQETFPNVKYTKTPIQAHRNRDNKGWSTWLWETRHDRTTFLSTPYKFVALHAICVFDILQLAYKTYDSGYTKKVACKVVNRGTASQEFVSKFLPRELSIIRSIRHPHIVNLLDIVDMHGTVYIFMDLCEKGDLLEFIRDRGPLPESRARHYARQLVSAVDYLTFSGHQSQRPQVERLKITDFGFARWCRDDAGRRILSDTFCGSAAYAAPEILQGTPYNPKMYDAWSLGCVLYIMLTATMPFDDTNMKIMLKNQLNRCVNFPRQGDYSRTSGSAKRLVLRLKLCTPTLKGETRKRWKGYGNYPNSRKTVSTRQKQR